MLLRYCNLFSSLITPDIFPSWKMWSSGMWRRVALVRTTNVPEEYVSIFRVTKLWFFPARSEDLPHDWPRREPLATAPPQLCLFVTVELLVKNCYFFGNVLIDLPIEQYNVWVLAMTALFWDVTPCGSNMKNRRFGGTYRLPVIRLNIMFTLRMCSRLPLSDTFHFSSPPTPKPEVFFIKLPDTVTTGNINEYEETVNLCCVITRFARPRGFHIF
jgi:hypothetical protein